MTNNFMKQRAMKNTPVARTASVIQGDTYRFTVLTSGLIRAEYSRTGSFEDRATQTVINRDFPPVQMQVYDRDGELEIVTERVRLLYDKQEFAPNGLSIQAIGNLSAYHSIWHYGEETTDLGGTARTLDEIDGAVELEPGLVSKNGFAVMDDSSSLILCEEGWVEPRDEGAIDFYFFGYGRAYKECIRDFYRLTGDTPLLPRYVFGNWWSRFHKYSEQSYKELICRFEQEQIPFSVAVIDMDWHVTEVEEKYGSGWTGYTWNRELFPDPGGFMGWLHEQGMQVTLNVHPAEGVQAYEEMYEEMAAALGKNAGLEEKIHFDVTDPEFMEAYFRYLHHPNEEQGVDFWWIDWQSGRISGIKGLDPLWMLNHFHYMDIAQRKKYPIIFSRYAGPGSHRYPIGFSGDTVVSWDSLRFQPYFTANATNIGYTWWSHDIGGHMQGIKEDELMVRWLQFGVFSPINRLHSSGSMFQGKEPWRYGEEAERIMKETLRLRHQLVPYLYTMNYLTHFEGRPLIMPMYYEHPWVEEAYTVPNEYYFGTELIVQPVTEKRIPQLRRAMTHMWFPEGSWYDFFTGREYAGGCYMDIYRKLEEIPVFAKAGAIVPLADITGMGNHTDNPESLELVVFPGADGVFILYEEAEGADHMEECFARTRITMDWEQKLIGIEAAELLAGIPAQRTYRIILRGWGDRDIILEREVPAGSRLELSVPEPSGRTEEAYVKELFAFLDSTEMEINTKEQLYKAIEEAGRSVRSLHGIHAVTEDKHLINAISELLWAAE